MESTIRQYALGWPLLPFYIFLEINVPFSVYRQWILELQRRKKMRMYYKIIVQEN